MDVVIGRRRRRTSEQHIARTAEHPLQRLSQELAQHKAARALTCVGIRESVRVSIKRDDRNADGVLHSHETLALDVWRGRNFTDRNRDRGWSWVPFYEGELDAGPDTPESVAARLNRTYKLTDEEKTDLIAMKYDLVGQIAAMAGTVAARIHAYPVWQHAFFDEHGVRVDLVAEVTSLTQRATGLRDALDLLGAKPQGHLRSDDEVVTTWIEKSRMLDRGIDTVLDRLLALDNYCDVVAGIQRRKNKFDWLERANSIDDLEVLIDDDLDRRRSDQLREAGTMSEMLAAVYLDTLGPITGSLTLTSPTE